MLDLVHIVVGEFRKQNAVQIQRPMLAAEPRNKGLLFARWWESREKEAMEDEKDCQC